MSRVNNTIDKFGRQRHHEKIRILQGPPGIGFRLNADGQYDIEGKCLTNLAQPINTKDATSKEYVLSEIHRLRKEICGLLNEYVMPFIRSEDSNIESKLEAIQERIYERPLSESLNVPPRIMIRKRKKKN